MLSGVAASPGIAIGKALVLEEVALSFTRKEIKKTEVIDEQARLDAALQATEEQLNKIKAKAEDKMGSEQAAIFAAHLLVVQDPELISAIKKKIETEKSNAETALSETIEEFVNIFSTMEDEYMRERAADIKDVGQRILKNLLGYEEQNLEQLEDEVILIANDLTPSDTAQVDKEKVLGFATEIGGRTSHTAIMSRSLEIPAVAGINSLTNEINTGDQIIVDGLEGKVLINPSFQQLKLYEDKLKQFQRRKAKLAELKELPAQTQDDHRVELVANIGTTRDINGALEKGAEGIGLYRTEFLYMDCESMPTEEEQYSAYQEVVQKMEDKPVIIRTLDIGGDKELPYLDLPDEMNPFLGYRAIRICLDRPDIFKTQLRAILRASANGNIKIMYPMIFSIEELRAANQVLEEVKNDLREETISFDEDIEVGMMIEVPAAALTADILAKEVDFFSIGTNDLIQYTTAVDRMNKNLSDLYRPLHPAVLHLIKAVIDAAHQQGKWVGMCGEMAGDIRLTPVLLGFGLDEFSMSADAVPEVKEIIRSMTKEEAKKIAKDILQMETAQEIKDYLDKL
ncbi:MAG: hypothetical protein AWU54_1649 [Candidatus Frackibacter sp. T328-2]|nr:MAG: hypothetical protein AWU54_1649 [Candidatus Frackibacter sp. T328-2]